MPASITFTHAVVRCLLHTAPADLVARSPDLTALVARVLGEVEDQPAAGFTARPSRSDLEQYLANIRAVLPAEWDHIALVARGRRR